MSLKTKPWFRTTSALHLFCFAWFHQKGSCDAAYLRPFWFRDLQQNATQVFNVNLFLTLSYVDNAIAESLASGFLDDPVVGIFCDAVYVQAGGKQVRSAAIDQDVIVITDSSTRDCQILDSHRLPGGLQGLYTLELHVAQSVLTSTTDLGILTTLIEIGFNTISDGGETFLNLLRYGNDFYDDLEEVGVISAGEFSSDAPTRSPSTLFFQTLSPTNDPSSMNPKSYPSSIPTGEPSSSSPTNFIPSVSLTHKPTSSPSLQASSTPTIRDDRTTSQIPTPLGSQIPSHIHSRAPFVHPSKNPSHSPSKRQVVYSESKEEIFTPLVISAIALGSLAVAICCCCMIRFICCGTVSKRDRPPVIGSQRKTGVLPSHQKLPFVPKVVELDDDNRSLANTTLGEHTAGRNPRKKRREMFVNTSFDDSVYTSSGRILPAYHVFDATISTSKVSRKQDVTPDRKSAASRNLVESPSLLAFSGHQTNFFASSDLSQSDTTDSQNLDFANDFTDDLFYGDDEGLLGAMAPSSPIADRIEAMVAHELDGSYSDSEGNLSSADNVLGSMDLDSPLDLLRLSSSNVELGSDEESLIGAVAGSDRRRKINFETIFGEDTDLASQSTRSSVTEMIANTTLLKLNDSIPKDVKQDESPSSEDRMNSSKALSAIIREKSMKRKSTLSIGSVSPNVPVSQQSSTLNANQTKSTHVNPPNVFEKTGETGDSPISLKNDGILLLSPTEFPVKEDEQAGKVSLASYLETPRDSRRLQGDDPWMTPQGWFDHGLTSPTVFRSSSISLNHPFLSPSLVPANQFKNSNSSSEAQVSPSGQSSVSEGTNSFLFQAIEQTLGPLSPTADLESLEGRSVQSRDGRGRKKSERKQKRLDTNGLIRNSVDNQRKFNNSEEKSETSVVDPQALAHDIERLEKELDALRTEVTRTRPSRSATMLTPPAGMAYAQSSPQKRSTKTKNCVMVTVPPGKLGIVLANRRDGLGAIVAEVKNSSSLNGVLCAGDKLVAIDGVDVTGMVVSEITSMMMTRSAKERHLTVITASKVKKLLDERKHSP